MAISKSLTRMILCVISGGPNLRETWNIKVTEFILVGPHNGKYYIFLDGKYYIPARQ